MATLLMRTPELSVVEKLSMAGMDHGRMSSEKGMNHGENEGEQKSSMEGRSRARKGKNAQKKQPQRGLGVAQLEKLRLQEQSKQEAACLASLQSLPTFGFTDQNGSLCFRPMKNGTIAHPQGHSSPLSFCSGRPGTSEKLSHYLAGDGRQLGKGAVDGDVFRSIMSLATSDHSAAGSLPRHAQGGRPVPMMLPRHLDDRENSYGCSSMRTVPSLASLTEKPGNRGPGSCGTSPEESPDRPLLGCLGSPPKSTAKSSLYSNAMSGINRVDSHPANVEQEEHRLLEADRDTVQVFPVPNTIIGNAEKRVDGKLLPAVGKDGAGTRFSLSNLQCFNSSSGPANLRRLPLDRLELPVISVALNCNRPKELSSFQSFSSNNTWSTSEKNCGRKRPWYALGESTKTSQHFESLDLNAPAGETDVAQECCNAGVAQVHECPGEAHYATVIIRSGVGNTLPLLKDKACTSWEENEVPNFSTVTDVGFHAVEPRLKICCSSKSKIKDCCSSVCSPCESPGTRRRCLSSPEVPVVTGVDRETSGDFLTLGLSSGSYPTSPQLEIEVDSKEAMNMELGRQVNRMGIVQGELDSCHQFQMSNARQDCAPGHTGGFYSTSCTDNSFFSAVGLSCRYASISSSNMTEDCHMQTGRKENNESLDLRLKLAL